MWKTLLLALLSFAAQAATNPNRAYPPSCLSFPLPSTPSGPAQVADFTAFGTVSSTPEVARATFWRRPCSNGKSALLVTLNRPNPREIAIFIPVAFVSQGGPELPVRLVPEPNTLGSFFTTQATLNQTYVVEFASTGLTINLNQAFSFRAFDGTSNVLTGTIAAYTPSAYPDSALPSLISGRITGSFFDTAHPGEGIFLEIGETGGVPVLFFAWFTYDTQGIPFWLIGQASVPEGTRTIQIPTQFFANGGFAGNFTNAQGFAWGTVTMSFPTCDRMTLQFTSGAVPNGVPTGNGTRNWSRLLGADGFACE